MVINVEVIDFEDMRYPTAGDWEWHTLSDHPILQWREQLSIKVTNTGDYKYNFLLVLHEMMEAILCQDRKSVV